MGREKSTAMKAMLGLINLKSGTSQLMVKIFQIYLLKIESNKDFFCSQTRNVFTG
ncbi:MAG: hypothetical protein Ct9H300mP5_5940 [Candidatus Pelagibacterales bacterium]|nr:MAG: hypothetical protein Ct9H300mP5_5940 [Pelagibacterales bacterium]